MAGAGLIDRPGVRVARSLNRQFAELALARLAAASAAGVASRAGGRLVPFVPEVPGHLRIQRPLDQPPGLLPEQAAQYAACNRAMMIVLS